MNVNELIKNVGKIFEKTKEQERLSKFQDKVYSLLEDGKYDEALELTTLALEENPKDCFVLLIKAQIFESMGEYEKQIDLCNKVLELYPKNGITLYIRACGFYNLQNYKEALCDCNSAIEASPAAEYYFLKGNIELQIEQYHGAITDYDRCLLFNPKGNPELYFNRGVANEQLYKFDEAILDYTKSIELDQYESAAYYNRARIYAELGKPELALNDINKSIEFDPDNNDAYKIKNELEKIVERKKKAKIEEDERYNAIKEEFDKKYPITNMNLI